jgi:hypothetical protein
MQKEFGWSLRGKRLLGEKSGNRKGKRISVVGTRNHKHELLYPYQFKGCMNKALFKEYLSEKLLPNLPKNSYLIMDNASFHKGKDIEELFKNHNINLMYLPPYSPDLNPIEKKWSQIKSLYKKLTHVVEDKVKLIELVLNYQYAVV